MNRDIEATPTNVVVLIDQFTKDTVDTVSYDSISKHSVVLTDIKELSETNAECDLVVFEPAACLIVTPEILDEFIDRFKIKVHLVYQHDEVVASFSSRCHLVKADYSVIQWNFIYAVVNSDLAILEPYQRSVRVLDSFKSVGDRVPADLREYLDRFRGSYIQLVSAVNGLIERNSKLNEIAEVQKKIGEQTVAGITELKELLDESQSRCNSYELLLSKSYDVVKGGFFPERPRVLYIKQISHVPGMDTLLSVLFSALTQQYKASVKVVKLVDAGAALQMRYIPGHYVPVQDSYNIADILQNDFVMKLGAFSVMFDTLLLNRSGLEYLIVHDMRSVLSSALDSTLIDLYINEVSADYAILGEYDNVLSDSSKKVTFPWVYRDIRKHTGTKSVRLVNHPTIVAILDFLV